MANTFESNFTRKVMMKVTERFEANRVLSKNVNTQLVAGAFNPDSGTQVDIKRPTDYTTQKTATGDISTNRNDIVMGKATATVQDYLTVAVDYNEVDEALKMGSDISRLWDDIANRIVIDLELDFAAFAMKGLGLSYGDPDEGVNNWAEIARTGAFMQSMGVPMNLIVKGTVGLMEPEIDGEDVYWIEMRPAEGGRYHRDPEYRKRKAALVEQLIDTSQQLLPDLREHIVWKEAATPVSQERFTRSTGGTSYGIEMSCSQAGPLRAGPRTEIEGLFLCGASTPSGPGIAGVMRGGVQPAGEVLDRDLLAPILAGNVLGDRSLLPELDETWDAWRESH